MATRQDIIEQARRYLGTPFRHQGRNAEGMDCVGLLIRVGKDLNLIDPEYDYLRYGNANAPNLLLDEMRRMLKWKPTRRRESGDILVFSLPYYPCHTAIYTGEGIIHAYNAVNKVVENRIDASWIRHLSVCFAIRGLEGEPCNSE